MDNALKTWVVAGAGPSLTLDQLEHVRGRAQVVVANNGFYLAPWADALAACDSKWWLHYAKDAQAFSGRKYAPHHRAGVTYLREPGHPAGCNSGLYAMMVARHLGAERILLLGIDLQGSHFFGHHPKNLRNPDQRRHGIHRDQFNAFEGPEVVNCSPCSTLERFRKSSIFIEL